MARTLKALTLLATDPVEFRDVLAARLEERRDRRDPGPPARTAPVPFAVAVDRLGDALGTPLAALLAEPALEAIRSEVAAGADRAAQEGPFARSFNASPALAQLCYAVTRALRPRVVVETGVAYGTTSAHLLQAMEANGAGAL